ncbi:ganglioside GM2 activator-like [Liolophura sinensis]|uniref:ganglioside GM2 activator-like n=1 Tax=Liolophura sinensis TaxID=3198878 RepID=UPI003158069A
MVSLHGILVSSLLLVLESAEGNLGQTSRTGKGGSPEHTDSTHAEQFGGVQWMNCGGKDDPVLVEYLSIQPDPVTLPGVFQLSFQFSVSRTLHSPIKFQAQGEKQIAIWVPVLCLDELGSCELEDMCALLPFVCPSAIRQHGIPCQCPIRKGRYILPPTNLTVTPGELPVWVTEALYKMTYRLSSLSQTVGCLHVEFSILDP